METKALNTIKKFNMLCPNDNILVAVSGGADSVALFHFLHRYKTKLNINIFVAHLNHGLRGAESDADEEFVKAMCKKYGVQFFVKRAEMAQGTAPKGMGCEEWARQLRYAFLYEAAKPLNAKIATAHSLSDNCETLVFHLARGTGIKGAAGISPVRGNIIRPFIEVTRTQIEEYCNLNKLEYVTDSTNLTDDYTRNKIRHNLLPQLESINPQYQTAIGRFLDIQREIDDYFTEKSKQIAKTAQTSKDCYDRKMLMQLPKTELKYFLYHIASEFSQIDNKRINLILDLFNLQAGAVQVSTDRILAINNTSLYWRKTNKTPDYCLPFSQGEFNLQGGINLKITVSSCKETVNFINLSKNTLKNYADYDKIQCDMNLRTRKQGDTFTQMGRNCTKSLKKLFNEDKILPHVRDEIPLLAHENTVLWLMGYGFAQGLAPTKDTKKLLVIEALNQNFKENTDV